MKKVFETPDVEKLNIRSEAVMSIIEGEMGTNKESGIPDDLG